LQGIAGLQVRSVQTNIVFLDIADGRGPDLLAFLKARGILATGLIGLRFVTHLNVDSVGIDRTIDAVTAFFGQGAEAAPTLAKQGASVY
jgi:threonine aldolase